jgi:hypothetical protein
MSLSPSLHLLIYFPRHVSVSLTLSSSPPRGYSILQRHFHLSHTFGYTVLLYMLYAYNFESYTFGYNVLHYMLYTTSTTNNFESYTFGCNVLHYMLYTAPHQYTSHHVSLLGCLRHNGTYYSLRNRQTTSNPILSDIPFSSTCYTQTTSNPILSDITFYTICYTLHHTSTYHMSFLGYLRHTAHTIVYEHECTISGE